MDRSDVSQAIALSVSALHLGAAQVEPQTILNPDGDADGLYDPGGPLRAGHSSRWPEENEAAGEWTQRLKS